VRREAYDLGGDLVELWVAGGGDSLAVIRDAEGITLWDDSDGDNAIDEWVTELNPDLGVFTQQPFPPLDGHPHRTLNARNPHDLKPGPFVSRAFVVP